MADKKTPYCRKKSGNVIHIRIIPVQSVLTIFSEQINNQLTLTTRSSFKDLSTGYLFNLTLSRSHLVIGVKLSSDINCDSKNGHILDPNWHVTAAVGMLLLFQ
jgi:hypothetical protein